MSVKTFDPKHAAAHGYTRQDWDDVDSPEATDEQVTQARPFAVALPEIHESIVRKRGPTRTKTPVSIRLDDDLVAKLRSSGPGWQARVNDALRRWIDDAA
ncbi:BrnA antitoxin family protein [Aureimonas altamirensis]|uniref:BrnA antitoxin family protein n=1 Tax=Aureimonas altamirensis TaxID=370622 RepID=UPI0020371FFF|nr:BrnA antitoxin family protein [Aureimonas altamirensis]MCM2504944.1 BrnA antitoxin family protein [Aureimonas altamirensis]